MFNLLAMFEPNVWQKIKIRCFVLNFLLHIYLYLTYHIYFDKWTESEDFIIFCIGEDVNISQLLSTCTSVVLTTVLKSHQDTIKS